MISELETKIDYTFNDPHMLDMAVTHASAQKKLGDYERLEFLGDRVASLVIAEILYKTFPDEAEGAMARRHAALVQKSAMMEVAIAMDLASYLRLSAGEMKAGGARKDTILADAAEAVIGAVYLDGGMDAATKLITKFWSSILQRQEEPPQDPKTALQEWVQAQKLGLPEYTIINKSGADHAPVFEIALKIDTMETITASAPNKRAAEKIAAQTMLDKIESTSIS